MPNTQWISGLRNGIVSNPIFKDMAKDFGSPNRSYRGALAKTILGTFAAGFIMKQIIDAADITDDDEKLTELVDRLYYNR